MICTPAIISNPFQLPYINPTFGGTSGTGGTGGGSPVNYTLIRWEGTSSAGGTSPGSSTCIYELYLFVNGFAELRLGNWVNFGGQQGHYTAAGAGTAFSLIAQTSYVWNASGTTTTLNAQATYVNGAISAGNASPSLGTGPASSWTPAGWTSLQNGNVDDSFVTVPITSTTFFGTARTSAFVGSNSYVTFGGGSSQYFGLSTTNPALDKFMFNAADRSYQRVGYQTGSK